MKQFTLLHYFQKTFTVLLLTATILLKNDTDALCKNIFTDQASDSMQTTSTIILFHPAQSFGGDYYYDVSLNDSIVYSTEWGTADTLIVLSEKEYTLSAITGKKSSLQIFAEKGKSYFVRCSIRKKLLLTQPYFEFIEKNVAEKELEKIKKLKVER